MTKPHIKKTPIAYRWDGSTLIGWKCAQEGIRGVGLGLTPSQAFQSMQSAQKTQTTVNARLWNPLVLRSGG